jgi:NAD(P)-dependent dehydrogenase (short-subunit alcohol dehydrogenase family)
VDQLAGAVVVVTGAASGIGRAMADAFAAEGARLVLADLDEAALDRAVAELGATGADAVGQPCDVADQASVEALRDRALADFGRVDVVCNNAGVLPMGPLLQTTASDWRWVLDVNVLGVVHGVLAFTPGFVAQGSGHVVNTASMAGHRGYPGFGAYAATKHAVVGLSEVLVQELAGTGVGVSVVCPSAVNTRLAGSERHRPIGLRNAGGPTPEQEATIGSFGQAIADFGMAPADVARQVVAAVREDRFWVMTHPDAVPEIARRYEDIVAGRTPGTAS